MADLLTILTNGASSLGAQRAASATSSHNIENANTPGYARQRAELAATLPAEEGANAFIGRGAYLQTVTQARDRFLEAQIPGALGQAARSSMASLALSSVHALDPEATGGVGDAISKFYTALRQLSQNAGDANLRAAAVGAARTLALTFQRTRAGIEDARSGLDVRLAGDVAEVNSTAQTVARLNAEVTMAQGAGGQPNDLLDARQKAMDRLAELTGATPVTNSDGSISLFLAGGTPLVVGDRASTLSALPDPANAGHLALQLAAPGGAPAPLAAVGGELGGLLDARDGALRDGVTAIDQLAWDLGGAVNAVHAAGTGLDGSTGLALFDFGAATGPDGAAARMAVTASIAADPRQLAAAGSAATLPGDGQNALALVATERQALAGSGLDAASTLAQITSAFGAAAEGLAAIASHDSAMRDHLTSLRESTSGVSIDDELIEMQKAQRAYQAILKVIQTADQMFDTLMKLRE
jgi:flagellar hook-associated protein 1 FlgK